MSQLIDLIKENAWIFHSARSKMVDVWAAEEKLGICFPESYAAYVCHFGAIGFGAVEWTGLNVDPELNVVRATLRAREEEPDFPQGAFVLRAHDRDGRIVICEENEQVSRLCDGKKEPICSDLYTYLILCMEEEGKTACKS